MKRRLIASSLALLFFLWLSLVCAGNFGLLLAGQYSRCSLFPVVELARDPRGGRLFFILALCSILLVFWMLFGRQVENVRGGPRLLHSLPGRTGSTWHSMVYARLKVPPGLCLCSDGRRHAGPAAGADRTI